MKAITAFPTNITVVAVSKGQPLSKISQAIEAGFTHFGENRVEEIEEKWGELTQVLRSKLLLHMVGHVQGRKVAKVVTSCDWVDSVDSLKLAQRLNEQAEKLHKQLNILIQINVSGEAVKLGYKSSARFERELLEIHKLKHLVVKGLMTIAPLVDDSEDARPTFKKLAQLKDDLSKKYPQLKLEHLSMGMTNDYPVAIEEGATMIRIGRGVFTKI